MNYKIGLLSDNSSIGSLLTQMGIIFDNITETNQNLSSYIMIIVDNTHYFKELTDYLRQGGSVLTNSNLYEQLYVQKAKKSYVKYLMTSKVGIYKNIGLIDFFSYLKKPKPFKNTEIIDQNLNIFYQRYEKGLLLVLPFNFNELIFDNYALRKRFPDERKELPSEIVSRISKKKIMEIYLQSIIFLLSKQNIPLIRKSVIPSEKLFIFRIDTDFCSYDEANSLSKLCDKYEIKATWFIDTSNEKLLSNFYGNLQDHEIAFHCDRHLVYDNYEENDRNIKTGLKILDDHGIKPKGFAAPFGEWNPSLQKAIENNGFFYSSEFGYAYDFTPFYPLVNDKLSSVMQIPIHPISAGRLRRSHYSDDEKIAYFTQVINEKMANNEPVVIYHHPHHKMLNVFEKIFQSVKMNNMQNLTLYDYARWWKKRISEKWEIDFDQNMGTVKHNSSFNLDVYYMNKVSYNIAEKEFKITNLIYENLPSFNKNDKISLRKWHWRDVLYNYEHKRGKKRL